MHGNALSSLQLDVLWMVLGAARASAWQRTMCLPLPRTAQRPNDILNASEPFRLELRVEKSDT